MRVLAITKIFPNAVEPLSAPFNRQQFAALSQLCELEVLATIPWFPGAGLISRWSTAGRLANVPAHETIEGISVAHPRTLFVPRLAHATWGPLYAASLAPQLHRYRGKVDVVLGSWAYPDGFAAVIAARLLGVPYIDHWTYVTGRQAERLAATLSGTGGGRRRPRPARGQGAQGPPRATARAETETGRVRRYLA